MSDPQPVRKIAVGDVPPNRRRGGDLRVMLSPRSVGSTSGFLGFGELLPGERITEHYHPYSEEFVYVIEGLLTLVVDGTQVLELGPGDATMIPIGRPHKLNNDGTEPVRVVFHNSPLAPSPELGHVDLEAPLTDEALPQVGGPRAGGQQ